MNSFELILSVFLAISSDGRILWTEHKNEMRTRHLSPITMTDRGGR